jgi:hypothetical protein
MRPAFAGITIAALIGGVLVWLFSAGSPAPATQKPTPAATEQAAAVKPVPRDPATMRPMQLPAKDDPSFKVIRRPGDPLPAGPKGDRPVVMPGQVPPTLQTTPGVVEPAPAPAPPK